MFGLGERKKGSSSEVLVPKEISAIIVNEQNMARILESEFRRKISRIGVDINKRGSENENYTVNFQDHSHSALLTEDQLSAILSKWSGQKVINITLEQRKEYMIRFKI